jgi:hypothetical protein
MTQNPFFHGHLGHTLLELVFALACLAVGLAQSLALGSRSAARWSVVQARATFEADWRAARWQAAKLGQALRLQAIAPCTRPGLPSGWHCGWQLTLDESGRVLQETPLPSGLVVMVKPNAPWRVDAWGDPLSGGASVLFESVVERASAPELLCMNVLGRLRRLRSEACSE